MARLVLFLLTIFVSWLGIWSSRTNPGVGTLGDSSATSTHNSSYGVRYRGAYVGGVWVSTSTRRQSSSFSGRGPSMGAK